MKDFMYTVPNKNRKPTDNSIIYHNWLNKGFKAVFGEYVRSKAVFCTEQRKKEYGEPYVIYPKNDFTFYHSKEINDIYYRDWFSKIVSNGFFTEKNKNILAAYAIWVFSCRYENYDVEKYIFNNLLKNESNKKLYKNNDYYIKFLINEYKDSGAEFVKKFYKKYTKASDLIQIKDGNEIMLICKGYYSVRAENEDLLNKINQK